MVHVSKTTLKKKDLQKLFSQLNETVGRLNKQQSEDFLSTLLGEEEKIMLAKRLSAILMLAHGQSTYRVTEVLKLSSSTLKIYKSKLDDGKYDLLLTAIRKQKKGYLELLETIDSILHLGGALPHYGQTHASEEYRRNKTR
ncbi:hypothetical protein CL653_00330 [bacterium]|nr:hypothetical protein [bacterium]|tara:strand:- start:244 stop:666 length:423 start_codon:yes stop_codon:yes gene_type:complete